MAKTMKQLFCNVCLLYDCGQHSVDIKIAEKGYQYITDKKTRRK
jgi:hypothetical protein